MNTINSFFLLFGLCATLWSSPTFAELRLVFVKDSPSQPVYGKVVGKQPEALWVYINGESMHIQTFTQKATSAAKEINLHQGVLALTPTNAINFDVVFLGTVNPSGDWSIISTKINGVHKTESQLVKQFEIVSEVIPFENKLLISGMSKEKRPIIVVYDLSLNLLKTIDYPIDFASIVTSVIAVADKVFISVSSIDGPPKTRLIKMSKDFSNLTFKDIDGGAASISEFRNGIAVSYSLGNSVYVHQFSAELAPGWRTEVLSRSGVSTLYYPLVEVKSGLGLIGGNSGRLIVVRLDVNGKVLKLISDEKTDLVPPTQGYSVSSAGESIHIRGFSISGKKSSPIVSKEFYFLDNR